MPNAPAQTGSNIQEFSVSELSFALKRTVEETYGYVRVRGEISGMTRARSGHVYLTLKDADAVLDGVMWKSTAARLKTQPEDGLEVVCSGKITTYPGRSKYQIIIDRLEPAGMGALMALLEERRKKLAAEGLFDEAHKKQLPFLPETIGVVTSPTGAVIRDILHRLSDRFPRHVIVWPVLVQGDKAADEVASAIKKFNALPTDGPVGRPDLLIVARGGGSIEDLWAFNEEPVVRAAFESEIPLISAVGHETDTTLIDFVSDQRAPTPTAAAEMAVPVRSDLISTTLDLERRLVSSQSRLLSERQTKLEGLARGLPSPDDILALAQQRFDASADRLVAALRQNLQKLEVRLAGTTGKLSVRHGLREVSQSTQRLNDLHDRATRAAKNRVDQAQQRLDATWKLATSLSHEDVLRRGFAIVWTADGKVVRRATELSAGDRFTAEFHGNEKVHATVNESPAEPPTHGPAKPAKPKPPSKSGSQGRLF